MMICLFCSPLYAELFFTPQMIESHLKGYSEDEIKLIEKDLQVVRSVCLDDTCNAETRFYLATAGAPGARKTTILERFVSQHPEYQEGVYLDPDPRTLKFMVHTYYNLSLNALVIASSDSYSQAFENAYNKWRSASNYIVLTLFEEAIAKGRSVIYGATSTGAHIPAFFAKLKENDYQIALILCSCPDEVRYEAVQYRNKVVGFVQSSFEDLVAKGRLFPQRMGAYFAYADLIYFYWSDSLFAPERLAGIWQNGKLEIHDTDAWHRFVAKYEADRLALESEGQLIPAFETYMNP